MGILVIDDSEFQRVAMEEMLTEQGFADVTLCESPTDALGVLNSSTDVDVILMDIEMPDIDGIDGCRLIKSYEELRDIPIIMVTSLEEMDYLKEAFEAGAIDYLVKPPSPVELGVRVGSALRLKQETDARKSRECELIDLTTKLADKNQLLRRLSVIDPLTGIPNRRYLDKVYEQEFKRSRREGQPLSVVMIDLDNFKGYNDTYGHKAGDIALTRVARALAGVVKRPTDVVARYGGEEFAAILPNTNLEGGLKVAEDLRLQVERLSIPHQGASASQFLTASLGVAGKVVDNDTGNDYLFEAADEALYRAKEQGRNRVAS